MPASLSSKVSVNEINQSVSSKLRSSAPIKKPIISAAEAQSSATTEAALTLMTSTFKIFSKSLSFLMYERLSAVNRAVQLFSVITLEALSRSIFNAFDPKEVIPEKYGNNVASGGEDFE